MMALPEGLIGKILALALCLGLAAIVYMAVVVPVVGFYEDAQSSLQERLDMVQRLDNSSRDLPRLRALRDQWQQAGSNMLPGDTSDTMAAASIQSTVRALIETGGGALTNSEMLDADQPDDQYRRIRVRVTFTGDLPLLTSVLRGIDVAKPALFVDNLDVRATVASDDSDEGQQKLAIAFDVYGFRSL